jgi:hypothetical protein
MTPLTPDLSTINSCGAIWISVYLRQTLDRVSKKRIPNNNLECIFLFCRNFFVLVDFVVI